MKTFKKYVFYYHRTSQKVIICLRDRKVPERLFNEYKEEK